MDSGDVQRKSLSPNGAILGNIIRQGEEVKVREKCGGFVLVVDVKIYKSRCVRIFEFLTQNHERQNTTDTHKTNPQATH